MDGLPQLVLEFPAAVRYTKWRADQTRDGYETHAEPEGKDPTS